MPSLLLFVLFASSLFPATVVSVPQDSPGTAEPALVPAAASLGGPNPTATSSCGGCFVVADVAAVIWYSQVFAYTAATAFVSIATGNTTGRSTKISLVTNTERFTINQDEFTIRPGATGAVAKLAVTPVTYGPNFTFSGAVLSSPTAYNVFTAFAVNSESTSGGSCVTEPGPTTTLSVPYSEIIADHPGLVTLGAAGEQEFVSSFLNLPSCRQSANVIPAALLPVQYVTPTVTSHYPTISRAFATRISIAPTSTFYSTDQSGTTTLTSVVGTFTAIPETEAAESSAASSGSESGSESGTESTSGPTTTTYPFASAPLIIVGNSTITPDRNPVTLPFYSSATSIAKVSNGVVVVVPTGTGSQAGNYTAIVPYLSGSGSCRRGYFWTSLWAATLSGIGLVMIWL